MLTVKDNQCLSKRCIVEALLRYTAHAIDVSNCVPMCGVWALWLVRIHDFCQSIPLHYEQHLFLCGTQFEF